MERTWKTVKKGEYLIRINLDDGSICKALIDEMSVQGDFLVIELDCGFEREKLMVHYEHYEEFCLFFEVEELDPVPNMFYDLRLYWYNI